LESWEHTSERPQKLVKKLVAQINGKSITYLGKHEKIRGVVKI
jgi:hypothetical protein